MATPQSPKTQELSPQQAVEAIKLDPWGYHQSVRERGNEHLDKILEGAKLQVQNFFNTSLVGLVTVNKLLSEELAIFRTIESHVQNGTANELIMNELFTKLAVFREEARKNTAAMPQPQGTTAAT